MHFVNDRHPRPMTFKNWSQYWVTVILKWFQSVIIVVFFPAQNFKKSYMNFSLIILVFGSCLLCKIWGRSVKIVDDDVHDSLYTSHTSLLHTFYLQLIRWETFTKDLYIVLYNTFSIVLINMNSSVFEWRKDRRN